MRQAHSDSPQAFNIATALILLGTLCGAWLLWSGIYKPLVLFLGAVSCLLSLYLAKRMGFFTQYHLFKVIPRLPGYWLWLLREIIKSSIEVAGLILKPSLPISPTVVELDAGTDSEVGQVIFANSITLSPGTVTLDVDEGKTLVHCLTREGAAGLQTGDARRRLDDLGLD